jgi:hypothetical protein
MREIGTHYLEYLSREKRFRVVLVNMSEQPVSDIVVEETWVNVTEAAELTGYHRDYVQKLARDNWTLPEDERKILVQRHPSGYMLWLPKLVDYLSKKSRGPQPKRKHSNTSEVS